MQKQSSTVVITAGVPRELRERLGELAKANYHSTAAEVRRALVAHVHAGETALEARKQPV
jgi:hypothetical protein